MFDPSRFTAEFDREHGVTEADWLATLRGAVGAHPLTVGDGFAVVSIGTTDGGSGRLDLRWQVLPPRRIALVQMPRMAVSYHFSGVGAAERAAFLRYFDLFMQRGGG
ncbi:MAG TPA: hypothetical protein PLW24_06600 [Burkholderiaceae bacterium]|nr:hypothetical protein [Burkholderiaceae bacterium]HNB43667.1 hypothetical protein [Burkholderiaceae bacterium]HNG79118.1 hypothetical protein [Burkholderiaceae bacterium]